MQTIADASPRPLRPLRIILPGGSGLLGQVLARHFQERGHHVTVLTRGPYTAPWQTVHWDGEHDGPWTEYLEGADVCINLAGRTVNCRYHAENRRVIYNSRIQSTRLLGRVIAGLAHPPTLWLNASAIALYKRVVDTHRVDLPLDETSALEDGGRMGAEPRSNEAWSSSRGFMARVVRDWEAAFFASATPRTRKVALRSAIVLSPSPGSAFAVLSNLVRLGLGGKQGNGRQFVSWIHQDDFARAVEFLIHHEDLCGPFNIAAPNPLPNREFMAALREAWDVPNGLPAPSLAIHIGAFLLRAQSQLVLNSSRVLPGRLLDAGFHFQFPAWPEAAEDLVRQWRHRND
ncbi:MAG: TIGR01777 family oxidoreductase [Terracidiphilus sp.]